MKYLIFRSLALCAICTIFVVELSAQSVVRVAAAANLRYVMGEIEALYESTHKGVDLQINYGASGTFFQQILSGAPYDLFLSADEVYPQKLVDQGVAVGDSRVYTCGKLALYGLRADVERLGFEVLKEPTINKISIANPRTAPYGLRSVDLLKSLGLWGTLEKKIVYGDSIAQAAQFATTGNADLGFVALSLLLNPEVKIKGSYYIIPENQYDPIAQAGVLIKQDRGADAAAKHFFDYLLGAACGELWSKYGYSSAP